ncbi:glycerophosphodiester phosphodiesterase [Rhodobacteraceae bacterium 2376]|uniref:Glycerophosphodiester phosphodiesterase n=1 Tax=Rhabdonatronobacter sediminivivens TaxID=2743469 RepID=A0A7Z0HYP1_9RHOB|nr:glycerophosphodiester phosphodiesterase family protein [Rhabdonatronobacter sediminivivens]NYS24729.1 glycerophosphodiester phosphodiesterase [Rhabdonatronobacter sediminivivens]
MTNPFRRPAGRPIIYGHRGARGVLPENTMAGFEYLRQIGIGAVELDVQNAAGRVPVVIHDPLMPAQLARDPAGNWLSDAGPRVMDLTLVELQGYDVGRLNPHHKYGENYPDQAPRDGARVPSLDEFAAWAKADRGLIVNIEIKSYAHRDDLANPPEVLVGDALAVLRRHGIAGQCVFSSFDWRVLSALRATAPEIARAYLTYEQPGPENMIHAGSPWMDGLSLADHGDSLPRLIAAQGGKCWNAYRRDVTPKRLAEAHDLGLAVNVWTVNDRDEMQEMIDMGVDGVITDYPATALELLAAN